MLARTVKSTPHLLRIITFRLLLLYNHNLETSTTLIPLIHASKSDGTTAHLCTDTRQPRSNMDNSRLGKLPAELRNNIWQLALQQEEPIELVITGKKLLKARSRPYTSLLKTCKALHYEARGIFYSCNTFCITVRDFDEGGTAKKSLRLFVDQLKCEYCRHAKLDILLRMGGFINMSRIMLRRGRVSFMASSIKDEYVQLTSTGISKLRRDFAFAFKDSSILRVDHNKVEVAGENGAMKVIEELILE